MTICLFEDPRVELFYPLALTRHVSALLVGTRTLRDRATRLLGATGVVLHGRAYLRQVDRANGENVDRPAQRTLFFNARLAVTEKLASSIPTDGNWIARIGDVVVAAALDADAIDRLDWDADLLSFDSIEGVRSVELDDVVLYDHLWDLIYDNAKRIETDWSGSTRGMSGIIHDGAHVVSPDAITIGEGSVVKPGAVIDASAGSVVIGSNVEVMSNAVIEGPCYVGDNSRIKIGAKIYEQTSIGPWCKVGGEVENSILLGYSNKQHDGFLGHSYLGSWVNLGADTNTSDLKNNYGPVRIELAGRTIDTGRMFLGSLIGDHSKTGINTMLSTGTVIGVAANVFGGGFPPKSIPSFSWGGAEGFERFRIDKAVELARIVMGRRGIEFTAADEALLRYLDGVEEYTNKSEA